ncbi:leucyl aminopeptidase family protein [Paenibacillus dokdonensis]|uniref:leucyl aminopeptidase family protein n=1 Tax=Paenibacillus dokdonensis TaxID=2567944 RepID=UPI0010A76F57|nr:leucyl aminopeptidase family protein [Paenibacillus dokdonensis]
MKFEVSDSSVAQVVILPVFVEDLPKLSNDGKTVRKDRLLPHVGARHGVTWINAPAEDEPDLLILGMGEEAKFKPYMMQEAAGNASRALQKEQRSSAVVTFEALGSRKILSGCMPAVIAAWVEGSLLGTYSFHKYKSSVAEQAETTIIFKSTAGAAWKEAIRVGQIRAEGTMWARDLTNEPPNGLRPRDLAERTAERFAGTKAQVAIYEEPDLEHLGFAGLTAVGRGSIHPPVFIEVRYCTDETKPLIALIGKGVTFDTGGISLKRDNDISDMRMDMAGAAAVLGALDILVRSGAEANVAVLVPSAENSPSDRALLPGEVIRYANGVTVQVGNTDSEGRLILADALIYAHRIGAKQAIDLATLTYSVVGALGSKVAAVLGDDELADALQTSGEPSGERLWQMPLVDEYEAYMHSDYADACNISSVGEAGVITSSLFLRKFVHPSLKWTHIDMNGPKESASCTGEFAVGATGFGARMLAHYVTNLS